MKVKGIASTMAMLDQEIARRSANLVKRLAAATPVDTGVAAQGWKLVNGVIVNDIDYISNLNGGSSDQAPAHFVEATVLSDSTVKPAGTIVQYTE